MTLVPKNRASQRVVIRSQWGEAVCDDPPRYSRQFIATKARSLRWKFSTCADLPSRRDNDFVRQMVKWWGSIH